MTTYKYLSPKEENIESEYSEDIYEFFSQYENLKMIYISPLMLKIWKEGTKVDMGDLGWYYYLELYK